MKQQVLGIDRHDKDSLYTGARNIYGEKKPKKEIHGILKNGEIELSVF